MSPRGLGVMESCRGRWQPGCVRCRRGCTTSSFGLLSAKMLVNALSVTQRAGECSFPLPHRGWVGSKSSASRDPRLALPCPAFRFPSLASLSWGAELRASWHLRASQAERLLQRWDGLMIGWHRTALISLRNGNEV